MKKIYLLLLAFTGILNAQIVNIPDANLKAALLSADVDNLTAINSLGNLIRIDTNNDNEIQVSEAQLVYKLYLVDANGIADMTGISAFINLRELNCGGGSNTFTTMDVSTLTNLTKLYCQGHYLTALDASNLTNLTSLRCSNDNLASLLLPNPSSLTELLCSTTHLTSLDLSQSVNLTRLEISSAQLSTINLSNMPNLQILDCGANSLTSLDLSGVNDLRRLTCAYNQLASLDVSGFQNLELVYCFGNPMTSLTLSSTHILDLNCSLTQLPSIDFTSADIQKLTCSNTLLTALDVSHCSNLTNLNFSNNPSLTVVNAKNGSNELMTIQNVPNLQFICDDESNIVYVYSTLVAQGNSYTVCNSYCSLPPGGGYNTLTGTTVFDYNNDGCGVGDPVFNPVKVTINDGVNTGSTFTNNGRYTFFTTQPNNLIALIPENPDYFIFSPSSASFNFPIIDNSVSTQNFCISANGMHPDLEIVLLPLNPARAGFDSYYKIVLNNKGNQMAFGSVNLNFDDAVSDFVQSSPIVDNQSANSLTWNFSNLMPFETRAYWFSININSPLAVPPVNAGDILDFTATVNDDMNDDTPEDNTFALHQHIVNSYDPNTKTCLEGGTVTVDNIGKYLHYNINFENTGASDAVNVVVKDIIDTTKFDINSLQLLYASHPVETKITGNKVEFIFENINLPPSATNPIGGYGNVLFKIKTLPTLTIGDEVANNANIYFDYNAPIDTNEARMAFTSLAKTHFVKDESVTVYPNPAKNKVSVKAGSNIHSLQLYDVQGRILETLSESKKEISIDLSQKQKGIYFLKVFTQNGSSIEKIIKE